MIYSSLFLKWLFYAVLLFTSASQNLAQSALWHRCQEFRQYLCLVEDSHEDEFCEEIDRLYSCLDQDDASSDSGSTGKKHSKAKKDKKAKARE